VSGFVRSRRRKAHRWPLNVIEMMGVGFSPSRCFGFRNRPWRLGRICHEPSHHQGHSRLRQRTSTNAHSRVDAAIRNQRNLQMWQAPSAYGVAPRGLLSPQFCCYPQDLFPQARFARRLDPTPGWDAKPLLTWWKNSCPIPLALICPGRAAERTVCHEPSPRQGRWFGKPPLPLLASEQCHRVGGFFHAWGRPCPLDYRPQPT